MSNAKMESGVVVITMTATVYMGKIRETHSSRIGFCGEYNKVILSEMSKEFKKIYAEQIESEYRNKSFKPDKVAYRVSVKSTKCEMILNGK